MENTNTNSPYYPGYEAWELYDALPTEVKRAHDVVWTGYSRFPNQFERRWSTESYISPADAKVILELDAGKHTLSSEDLGFDMIFRSVRD
jgi:hypothetical protein